MKTITFPTRIEKVATKDTTRYAVQKVLVVNPEGADAYAVATDGKCLAVAIRGDSIGVRAFWIDD